MRERGFARNHADEVSRFAAGAAAAGGDALCVCAVSARVADVRGGGASRGRGDGRCGVRGRLSAADRAAGLGSTGQRYTRDEIGRWGKLARESAHGGGSLRRADKNYWTGDT